MKICKESFRCWAWLYEGFLIVILFAVLTLQSQAAIYTLNSATSVVTFDSGAGLTGWTVNGSQQLSLESFYYSLGGGPLSPITGISPATVTTAPIGPPSVTATYSAAGNLSVQSTYGLIGNQLSDSIKVSNLSGTSQTISLFQFSDFVLGGAAGGQPVNMFMNSGTQAEADQNGGGVHLVDQGQFVGTGGTTEMQASSLGGLFGPFLGGPPYTLSGTPLTASGNAVYAFEWDATLAANTSFTISEISTITVPEPAVLALGGLGVLGLTVFSRRNRS